MLKWDETDPHIRITRAYPCTINQGIVNENGICLDLLACIYMDDAFILAIDRAHISRWF